MPLQKLNRKDKAVISARVRALSSPQNQNQIEAFVPTPEEVQACCDQYVRTEKFLTDRRRQEQQRRA